MIVTLEIGRKLLDFDITHYQPEQHNITSGQPDYWEEGWPAKVEYELNGSEAEKNLFWALANEFDLYDRIECLLLDKIEKGEDL